MAKTKEPTAREMMIYGVSQALMEKFDLTEIPLAKEGLVLNADEETFVVKIIQKKNPIYQEDIKQMIELAPEAEEDEEASAGDESEDWEEEM